MREAETLYEEAVKERERRSSFWFNPLTVVVSLFLMVNIKLL